MAKLLAPYNNAMRLGQGFNSYTQQICIDDAVVIDPDRAENVVNNSGMTMRMFADELASNLATTEFKAGADSGKTDELGEVKMGSSPEIASLRDKVPKMVSKDDDMSAESLGSVTKRLGDYHDVTEKRVREGVMTVRRGKNEQELPWSAKEASAGKGQIVTYTSKFVNKLSEITDDLSISGSLAIKYNAIGGSGSGAFFDAEKFYEGDLKYYVSVKVINQSINYKDTLAFNPLRSCMHDKDRFKEVFGDSFISGFLEGGEFNALVIIKVHNKQKLRDIQAEAKIAITAGPAEISAQGNLKLAEENVNANSETSIYVRWCGGGNIKPYNQEWTMDSVQKAAARFPALVDLFPQRTYAILTKYENLRSYLLLKSPTMTPLRYEVAQMYTNMLLDAYMEYKSLTKRISSNIDDIITGLKEFKEKPEGDLPLSNNLAKAGLSRFPSSIAGLDKARQAIQRQMNLIVTEVDKLADEPTMATDEKHEQPFVGPASFECLVPTVDVKESRKRTTVAPLDGKRINEAVDPAEAEQAIENDEGETSIPLFDQRSTPLRLSLEEQQKISALTWQSDEIGRDYRANAPVGNAEAEDANFFCSLDFAQNDAVVTDVIAFQDSTTSLLASLCIGFSNGLVCTLGKSVTQKELDASPLSLTNINPKKEWICAGTIQVYKNDQIAGIQLRVSEQKSLNALYKGPEPDQVKSYDFSSQTPYRHLAGLWGKANEDKISRLGFIWGRSISQANNGSGAQSDDFPCVSGSLWVNSRKEEETARFFKTSDALSAKPANVIYAPYYFKANKKSVGKVQGGVRVTDVTNEGFTIAATPRDENDAIFCSWMVLPESKSLDLQADVVKVEEDSESLGHWQKVIPFRLHYDEGTIPDVVSWFTVLDLMPSQNEDEVHVKTYVKDVTRKGFTLVVDSANSSAKSRNITVGWMSHKAVEAVKARVEDDKNKTSSQVKDQQEEKSATVSKPSADFISGSTTFSDFSSAKTQKVQLMRAIFPEKPKFEFLAMNELRTGTKKSFGLTINVKEKEREHVLFDVGPIGDDVDVRTVGVTWAFSV